MLIVKIKVGQAQSRQVKLKTGEIRNFVDQVGFIEVDEETRKVRIPIDIESGQRPYEAGSYVVAEASFGVSRFGALEVNPYRLKLLPLSSVAEYLPRNLKAAS